MNGVDIGGKGVGLLAQDLQGDAPFLDDGLAALPHVMGVDGTLDLGANGEILFDAGGGEVFRLGSGGDGGGGDEER